MKHVTLLLCLDKLYNYLFSAKMKVVNKTVVLDVVNIVFVKITAQIYCLCAYNHYLCALINFKKQINEENYMD